MRHVAIFTTLLACSGADGSDLLQDASQPTGDASTQETSVEDATSPPVDAAPPPADAKPVKDAGTPYQDPGIACGNADCDPAKDLCCASITSYYPQYTYAFACEPLSDLVQCAAGLGIYCDSDHDCPDSGVCCGDLDGQNHFAKVSCKPTCTGQTWPYTEIHFCDPKNPDCDSNQKCAASTALPGYYVCQ
jgi:hypothetical protein